MTSSIRHRVEKLEAANRRRATRVIWEDGTGSAEREIARLEAAGELHDKLRDVELHIVHWADDASVAAADELMRKRIATRASGVRRGSSG